MGTAAADGRLAPAVEDDLGAAIGGLEKRPQNHAGEKLLLRIILEVALVCSDRQLLARPCQR